MKKVGGQQVRECRSCQAVKDLTTRQARIIIIWQLLSDQWCHWENTRQKGKGFWQARDIVDVKGFVFLQFLLRRHNFPVGDAQEDEHCEEEQKLPTDQLVKRALAQPLSRENIDNVKTSQVAQTTCRIFAPIFASPEFMQLTFLYFANTKHRAELNQIYKWKCGF